MAWPINRACVLLRRAGVAQPLAAEQQHAFEVAGHGRHELRLLRPSCSSATSGASIASSGISISGAAPSHGRPWRQTRAARLMTVRTTFFGEPVGMARGHAGEQSSTYKAMFAVQKAFSIVSSFDFDQDRFGRGAETRLGAPGMSLRELSQLREPACGGR